MVVIKMWSAWPQRPPSPGRRLHWFSQPRAICWPCRRWDRGSARPPSKSACSSSVRKPPNITRLANHKTPLSTCIVSLIDTHRFGTHYTASSIYVSSFYTSLDQISTLFIFPFGLFAVAPFFCSAIAPNCPPFICFFFIDLCAPAQVMVLFNLWFEIRRGKLERKNPTDRDFEMWKRSYFKDEWPSAFCFFALLLLLRPIFFLFSFIPLDTWFETLDTETMIKSKREWVCKGTPFLFICHF